VAPAYEPRRRKRYWTNVQEASPDAEQLPGGGFLAARLEAGEEPGMTAQQRDVSEAEYAPQP
jgi:hypothetical protein